MLTLPHHIETNTNLPIVAVKYLTYVNIYYANFSITDSNDASYFALKFLALSSSVARKFGIEERRSPCPDALYYRQSRLDSVFVERNIEEGNQCCQQRSDVARQPTNASRATTVGRRPKTNDCQSLASTMLITASLIYTSMHVLPMV